MEGKLRQIANPHCEKRTELILKQLEENDVQNEDTDFVDDEDEVSFIYYGENCTCSKNSMCKSKKCLCFLRGEKCKPQCHNDLKTKCSNK